MENINTIFCINNEKYAFDLNKIKEFCLTSDRDKTKEQEMIDNFESNENTGSLDLVSRISREVKSQGNPQNDSILYDALKLFIGTLLSTDLNVNSSFSDMNLPLALAFNTLIVSGILYKID